MAKTVEMGKDPPNVFLPKTPTLITELFMSLKNSFSNSDLAPHRFAFKAGCPSPSSLGLKNPVLLSLQTPWVVSR